MDSKEFAKNVGGKIADGNDTGAKRLLAKELLLSKNNNEDINIRKEHYIVYIPTLYYYEICDMNPEDIDFELIKLFWTIFDKGIDIFKKEIDEEGKT